MEIYLDRALSSIERQTIGLENIEILMVNDGSTDNTKEIMEKYSKKHNNFHSFHCIDSSGAAGKPRNIGIQAAIGDYLMFLDPDDFYEDTACHDLYTLVTEYSADMCIGNYYSWINNEKFANYLPETFDTPVKFISSIDEFKDCYKLTPTVWTKIFKRDFIIKNNILFPEKIKAQDIVFSINALLLADGIVVTKNFITNYVLRNGEDKSASFNLNLNYFKSLSISQKMVFDLFCENSKKEDYRHLLSFSYDSYFISKLLDAVDLSDQEMIEAMQSLHWFFEKAYEMEALVSTPPIYNHIAHRIIAHQYNETVLLIRCINKLKNKIH